MNNLTLSYSLTLPQSIYPNLNYLMSINKRQIKSWLNTLWNNETLNRLKREGKAVSLLKETVKRTEKWIPSRVYRNSLEQTGQILRSQIERKEIYEYIVNHPCTAVYDESCLADHLGKSPLFILNVQRQIRKQIRRGYVEKDYLKAVKPDYNANVFITSADDSVSNGKFKKMEFYKKKGMWFMRLKMKLPTVNQKFRWFEINKVVPGKVAKMLMRGAKPKAPIIKKETLSNGYEIFRLVIPFEMEVKIPGIEEVEERVLAIDLSPGGKRLAVMSVVEERGHSKPVFLKAERIVRKIERIQKEIDRLEKRIDHIADDVHTTRSKTHRSGLQRRLKHLYQEQRRRRRKIKQIRKEILEIFTNWIVEYARSYGIKVIAVERLSFKDVPEWKSSKAVKRFVEWFYSRVRDKLEYRAKLRGIRIIEVNPANTSRYCHRCGKEGEAEKLTFRCECGEFDRDYNASVNIGKRAIKVIRKIKEGMAGKSKSRGQSLRDTPARNPFRQGLASFTTLLSVKPLTQLLAYSHMVESSAMKLKKLTRWIDLHDYGFG